MNDTATLRERLRDITGTFKASDFSDVPSSHAILGKMARKGEIVTVSDRKPKVYKVGKLKDHKPRLAPKAIIAKREKVEPVPLYVELWRAVYPDLFEIPNFTGYRSTVRQNRD